MKDQVQPRPPLNHYSANSAQPHPSGALPAASESALLLRPEGEQAPLPEEIYRILVKVVEALREGKVITVVPQTQRLTTRRPLISSGPASQRTAALDRMTEDASSAGIYGGRHDDYAAALRRARKRHTRQDAP